MTNNIPKKRERHPLKRGIERGVWRSAAQENTQILRGANFRNIETFALLGRLDDPDRIDPVIGEAIAGRIGATMEHVFAPIGFTGCAEKTEATKETTVTTPDGSDTVKTTVEETKTGDAKSE